MKSENNVTVHPLSAILAQQESCTPTMASLCQDGMIAGVIGAITIALWFLLLDTVAGRPLYTPTVLGAAFFHQTVSMENLSVSLPMVLEYSVLHWLAFTVMGCSFSCSLRLAGREATLGFGALLLFVLFVLFEFAFRLAGVALFTQQVLYALAWQKILIGNLLAAAAMGTYLLRRHCPVEMNP